MTITNFATLTVHLRSGQTVVLMHESADVVKGWATALTNRAAGYIRMEGFRIDARNSVCQAWEIVDSMNVGSIGVGVREYVKWET